MAPELAFQINACVCKASEETGDEKKGLRRHVHARKSCKSLSVLLERDNTMNNMVKRMTVGISSSAFIRCGRYEAT